MSTRCDMTAMCSAVLEGAPAGPAGLAGKSILRLRRAVAGCAGYPREDRGRRRLRAHILHTLHVAGRRCLPQLERERGLVGVEERRTLAEWRHVGLTGCVCLQELSLRRVHAAKPAEMMSPSDFSSASHTVNSHRRAADVAAAAAAEKRISRVVMPSFSITPPPRIIPPPSSSRPRGSRPTSCPPG